MEYGTGRITMATPLPYDGACLNESDSCDSVDDVLTDLALNELKRQSANVCLLCWFEGWDGEDWD